MFRHQLLFAVNSVLAATAFCAEIPPEAGTQLSPAEEVRVPGTSLRISLPAGWEVAPAKQGGFSPTAIHYRSDPGFEVTVKLNDQMPHAEAHMSLPFECDFMLGSLRAALNFQLVQRPDFIPAEYYSRVLVPPPPKQGEVLSTCLYLGNSALALMINPAPGPGDGPKLRPLLRVIAEAGKEKSTLLYAPGRLNLPVLKVSAFMSSGIWASGSTSLPIANGKTDLLVRLSGTSELKVLPRIAQGTCSIEQLPDRKKAPPYVSASWEPFAWEAPAPNGQLQLAVCRNVAPGKMLFVSMEYGAPVLPPTEAAGIAKALDEIAEAILTGPH